ncbi:YifB family Mg chelatase-like AAA ATPase [Halotalea alkalilenta]|uniref:ATP-dependent protease n=1 Tax=Halotalea alkalilenta TaxID=376489 RepID=A0A172YBS6_9GAMM|nr:YifB family Mg chelatase-like AAA ATPase [Halotalea alkalilenta]ANF56693.1 ATP-dependent protease [Halotalea alkalilenta]
MSLAVVRSRALLGLHAPLVQVEVHISNGLPGLAIVGLPETAVKESRERVRSALLNAGAEYPTRRITLNLAPADLPKEGGRFDLPIALAILVASNQLPPESVERLECLGELALDGRLRGVGAVLPAALAAHRAGAILLVASEDAEEAALVEGLEVIAADHLLEVVAHLHGRERLLPRPATTPALDLAEMPDLCDVRGQHQARRALEIAAAGGHNLLFAGPPGTGKSMLAARLPGLLPPLDQQRRLEVAMIRSRCGLAPLGEWGRRPFRSPHHGASPGALIGGGSQPMPGEITLAHHGVLFLDELPEFERRALEGLREPIECGTVSIARVARQAIFPAEFQLVAAMNPCPCGHLGDPRRACRCSAAQIQRYQARLSGPLLDRIDLQVEMTALAADELARQRPGEASASVRERVVAARRCQASRGALNARLGSRELEAACALSDAERAWLAHALERLGHSTRTYHRVLRVALTIADLQASARLTREHLMEALGYRQLDRLLRGDGAKAQR